MASQFLGLFAHEITTEAMTATKTPATLKALPNPSQPLSYHVHRTASQQLPVYHLAKRGGNLHQTRVRKIDGNIADLRNDLQRALGLKEEHITINQLTKHIIIKVNTSLLLRDISQGLFKADGRWEQGWRKPEVSNYLEQMQF